MNESELEASSSFSKGGEQNMVYGYATANPESYSVMKPRGNLMKKNPKEAEALLWNSLKNKTTGHKIRLQQIIQNFIFDFVCLKRKLVIEVDGKIHDQQKDYDQFRTDSLNQLGYTVIRFTNGEVLQNPERVVNQIKAILNNYP